MKFHLHHVNTFYLPSSNISVMANMLLRKQNCENMIFFFLKLKQRATIKMKIMNEMQDLDGSVGSEDYENKLRIIFEDI